MIIVFTSMVVVGEGFDYITARSNKEFKNQTIPCTCSLATNFGNNAITDKLLLIDENFPTTAKQQHFNTPLFTMCCSSPLVSLNCFHMRLSSHWRSPSIVRAASMSIRTYRHNQVNKDERNKRCPGPCGGCYRIQAQYSSNGLSIS